MFKNKVQLIVYPDSLGKNLKDLNFVLDKYLKDYVGGVHLLPFYPSSADRGFCPLTHLKVDPEFGNWGHIRRIAKKYDLMVDLIANHISTESEYFQDYLLKGNDSKYSDLFLTLAKVFPKGKVKKRQLDKIYRPRPTVPYVPINFGDGTTRHVWTTFNPEQADLNWESEATIDLMRKFLVNLAENGAKIIRLDAVGYIVKKLGTNSFFIPEVYEIIEDLKGSVEKYDVKFLPEVHKDYVLQMEIAKNSDLVYDFSLPPLVLYALHFGDFEPLKTWVRIRAVNQITVLDTHDGIGIVDVAGQLQKRQLNKLKVKLYEVGGHAAMRASGINSNNVDVYQINATFYSALGSNDVAYMMARAIQFFVPGIPQVYYVGLLAGENDIELLSKTNVGRDINRHNYTLKELEKEFEKPVVKALMKLMKFRNEYPAFDGKFEILTTDKTKMVMRWKKGVFECMLEVDVKIMAFDLSFKEKVGERYEWIELELFEKKHITEDDMRVPEQD